MSLIGADHLRDAGYSAAEIQELLSIVSRTPCDFDDVARWMVFGGEMGFFAFFNGGISICAQEVAELLQIRNRHITSSTTAN